MNEAQLHEEADLTHHHARFSALFRGRETGLWARDGGEEAEQRDAKPIFLPTATLTVERFVEHVSGRGCAYGIELLDGHHRVHLSMFDIDALPRDAPREDMLPKLHALQPKVLRLRDVLYVAGIERRSLLIEFSGTGFHLWFFYVEPITATTAAAWMRLAILRAGLSGIPFKPQRTEIIDGRHGDRIWLPLRINSNQGNRSVFVEDLERFDPAAYDQTLNFALIDAVVPLEREPLAELCASLGRPAAA